MIYDSKKQKFEIGDLVWYENLPQIMEMQSRGISTGPISGIVIDLVDAHPNYHSKDGAFSAAVKIQWLNDLEAIWYNGYNLHHLGYITITARATSQRVNPQADNANPVGGKREVLNTTSDERQSSPAHDLKSPRTQPQTGKRSSIREHSQRSKKD